MSTPRTDALSISQMPNIGTMTLDNIGEIIPKILREWAKLSAELASEREKVAKLRDALSDMLFPAGAFTKLELGKLLADTAPTEGTK